MTSDRSTRNPGVKRLYQVIGEHAVDGHMPGETFQADLEPDHPWIWGGHVAAVKDAKKKPEEDASVED